MVLTDRELAQALVTGELVVTPIINPDKQLGASSIDLRLGTEFIVDKVFKRSHFDVTLPPEQIRDEMERYSEGIQVAPMTPFILHPSEFALGSTLEYLKIPSNLI